VSSGQTPCEVCGSTRDLETEDTWFFIGGPSACKHVCSRACLLKFAYSQLPEEKALEALGSTIQIKRS
jgi:hypothetical protein